MKGEKKISSKNSVLCRNQNALIKGSKKGRNRKRRRERVAVGQIALAKKKGGRARPRSACIKSRGSVQAMVRTLGGKGYRRIKVKYSQKKRKPGFFRGARGTRKRRSGLYNKVSLAPSV